MSEDDRTKLLDLIVAWDELRDRGETASPEELCGNNPPLQAALRLRIEERLRIEQLIATPSTDSSESPGKRVPLHVPIVPGRRAGKGSEGPEHIGRYRVERLLGSGGFGQVFLAYDDELSRYVAVKIPHRELLTHERYVETYRREARSVAGLDHPHIVPVYDVGSTDTHLCFIVSNLIRRQRSVSGLFGIPQRREIIGECRPAQQYNTQRAVEQSSDIHRESLPAVGGVILVGYLRSESEYSNSTSKIKTMEFRADDRGKAFSTRVHPPSWLGLESEKGPNNRSVPFGLNPFPTSCT